MAPCAACGGDGLVPVACIPCGGRGRADEVVDRPDCAHLSWSAAADVDCRRCSNTGRVVERDRPCPPCGGAGVTDTAPCATCPGTGEVRSSGWGFWA